MDTKSVWDLLSSIPIGTVLAWVFVIAAIATFLCTGTIKLYKVFTKYKKVKDENEKQKSLLDKHDKALEDINESLKRITEALEEQKEVNLKQIRHEIVHTCDDAISAGKISASKLRSLEEMYEEYIDVFHGNGYVKTLVCKVRTLPVVGRLDE